MLFLLFQLGDDRYALEIGQIVEVLPMVSVKAIPQAVPGVAGLFTYRGTPVPLIDLSELALGTPSRPRISTRIVLVQYVEAEGSAHLLGLLAEKTSETLRRAEADFVDSGVSVETAPYLGPVTTDARGIIQRVEVKHLLPASVRAGLFCQPLEPA
jgi:chemotaxis-related protein WspB